MAEFSFYISNHPLPRGVEQEVLEKTANLVAKKVGNRLSGRVDLTFVSKKNMTKINKRHSGNEYPTDVLSFDYHEGTTSEPLGDQLGEIIICSSIARQQAEQYEIPMQAEVCLLLVHGLLHLSGYDHQDEASQTGFGQLQNAMMEELALKTRQFKW